MSIVDSNNSLSYKLSVSQADDGERLDKFLAASDELNLSRSHIKRLIESGFVEVSSGRIPEASLKVHTGEDIILRVPPPEPMTLTPLHIPLDIIYEDKYLLVLDKPAGLVVHPGAGRETCTLVHALLAHCRDLSGIGGVLRPGIVHRLDRDTSGLMIVAKDDQTHRKLVEQFSSGLVKKCYLALVRGTFRDISGKIDMPVGRHPVYRKRMLAPCPGGKQALSVWEVKESFSNASLVKVRIHTGRTHQIRVHMAAIGHPVLGDQVYGGRGINTYMGIKIPRQMLHAAYLSFYHPLKKKDMDFKSPLPHDMQKVIDKLS